MDDTTPPEPQESPESYEPSIHLMPEHEPKSGCLLKLIGILVMLGITVGTVVYLGVDTVKSRLENTLHSAPPPTPAPTPTPLPVPTALPDPSLALARQLIAADATTRKTLAVQLAGLEGSRQEAIQFLSQSLSQAAPEVKPDIIVALGLLAKKDAEAMGPLLAALDDKALRKEAIPALGAIGPAASPALPKLKKLATNKKENKSMRQAAQKAIRQIQGKKPAAKSKRKRTSKRR